MCRTGAQGECFLEDGEWGDRVILLVPHLLERG